MFKLIKFIIGLVIFLIISVIIFAVVIIVLNRGNKPKSKTVSPSYTLGELNTLTVNVDVKDSYVVVKKSKDGKVNFNYYASQTRTFEETTETDALGNVTLSLKGYQTGKWYNRLFLTFKTTKVYGVTIEVPDDCNVSVKTNNGNIRFEEVYLSTAIADTTNGAAIFKKSNASICSLNTVNGNVEASSSNVGTFYCRARKGKVNLDNLVSLIDIDASTDDGNIILTNSYATGNFKLHSGKGDITGSIRLLSDAYYKITTKAFNGTTNQQNTSTGIAELLVTTDNGNINLELKKGDCLMTRSEEAYKLFIEDKFHCSQAVIAVFPEYIDRTLALKISSCFGGGMRKGEVCGAVTGALMILGIAFGYSDKDDLEHKALSNKIASDFMDLFKNKFNSYLCKDIIKDRPTCGMYVKFAVEAVEEIINRG